MNNKVKPIEGIRGLACFIVLLSHLTLIFFPFLHNFASVENTTFLVQKFIHDSPLTFIFSGTSAVFIFFVLSGYVLTYAIFNKRDCKTQVISMSLKRYPRLMIPAVTSCVLAYFCFRYFTGDKSMFTPEIGCYGKFEYSLMGAIYSGTVDAFFLSGKSLYNPVLWTMKIELVGSFLIFSLCLLRLRTYERYVEISCFIFLTILTVMKIIGDYFGLGLLSFLLGYWFYHFGKEINFYFAIFVFVLGLYFAGTHNDSVSYAFISKIIGNKTYLLGNFISGFLIVYAIIYNQKVSSFFSRKIFVFIGKLSFSVYLIHLPIVNTFGVFFFNLLYGNRFSYVLSAILVSVTSIFVTYLAAIIYYNVIDKPGMNISSRFSKYIIGAYFKIPLRER